MPTVRTRMDLIGVYVKLDLLEMEIHVPVRIFVYVIAWAWGQLKINFRRKFKVFTKLFESRSDEGNLENFENTSEINP